MATSKRFADFEPNPEQLSLVPDITGATINGVGEPERRRPDRIYWHDPKTISHGDMQLWFYTQNNSEEATDARKAAYNVEAESLPKIADTKVDLSAKEWTKKVKKVALDASAELVGVTKMRPEWYFEGVEFDFEWIIIFAVKMDYEKLSKAPSVTTSVETMAQYMRGTMVSKTVARWIREQGWDAYSHCGPTSGSFLLIPPAIECGIGQLGKHGSMISKEYGSSFRLAGVLTNLPLLADNPVEFGSEEFCINCQICTNACPVDAITNEKVIVRGENKWYVDFDKCILFFNEHQSCGICIAECPWSRPGVAVNLAQKYAKRQNI